MSRTHFSFTRSLVVNEFLLRARFDAHTWSMLIDPTRGISTLQKKVTGSSMEQMFGGTGPMKTGGTEVAAAGVAGTAAAPESTDTGAVGDLGSTEDQSAQRRLARLSKYLTSPSGVLDTPSGSAGVF